MPQQRGIPPREAAERVIGAQAALKAAKLERDAALASALNAGGSVREVAAIAGMSERQVQNIGHANGWPSESIKRRRAQEAADRQRWHDAVEVFRKTGKLPTE